MVSHSIYLCGITAQPPHPEIHKTALGAEDTVEWKYFPTALDAVAALKEKEYIIYSIEQCEGATMLQTLFQGISSGNKPNGASSQIKEKVSKYAIILGNEVKGVHQEVVDASDGCIEIPQFGTKHSLNVSTTAGIVIWEFAKRLLMN